jgi:hypothetical protein
MRNGKIGFAVVSTHARQISGDPLMHQRCLALLPDFGGRILAEHDVHESFSGDGLIAAYFGERPLDWVGPRMSYSRYSNAIFPNPIYELDEVTRERNEIAAELIALQARCEGKRPWLYSATTRFWRRFSRRWGARAGIRFRRQQSHTCRSLPSVSNLGAPPCLRLSLHRGLA